MIDVGVREHQACSDFLFFTISFATWNVSARRYASKLTILAYYVEPSNCFSNISKKQDFAQFFTSDIGHDRIDFSNRISRIEAAEDFLQTLEWLADDLKRNPTITMISARCAAQRSSATPRAFARIMRISPNDLSNFRRCAFQSYAKRSP